jgi:hypothetical protein
MLKAATTPEHSIYDSAPVSRGADSKHMSGEGAEPELDFANTDCVSSDFRVSQPTDAPAWHRPFGEALLTGDSTRVRAAIVHAQRAILNRYLELAGGGEAQPDEETELGNAIDILRALKRTYSSRALHLCHK